MGNPPQPTAGFKEFLDAYHLALGRFVDRFAHVEGAVYWTLCTASQVPGLNAKAVFSGVRIETACSQVRRIYEINDKPLPKMLERAFSQLKTILEVRNSILHYGYMAYPELNWITSNQRTALPNKAKELPISPKILDQMSEDLVTISFCLGFQNALSNPLDKETMQRLETCAQAPWQYTPASPAPAHKKAKDHHMDQGKYDNPHPPSQE